MGKKPGQKVRYAVVGLGHIAHIAVLPAFAHANQNSTLAALVSSSRTKLKELGRRYRVEHTYNYDHFDDCLNDLIWRVPLEAIRIQAEMKLD